MSVMGCGTSKVLPEPPKDVQLDLVKKVEPFSGTKSDVYKHFITEVDSVGPLKGGFPAASQGANPGPGAPRTGHTEPPSEPPRRARVAKYRAKFDPRVTAKYDIKALIGRGSFSRVVRTFTRLPTPNGAFMQKCYILGLPAQPKLDLRPLFIQQANQHNCKLMTLVSTPCFRVIN